MPCVLIADRHPITRRGLWAVLERDAALRIGPLVDHIGAIEAAVEGPEPPDVIVTEVRLRDGETLRLIRALRHTHPEIAVVVVTNLSEWFWVEESLQAGARAVLHKSDSGERISTAVRTALRGEVFVSPAFGGRLSDPPRSVPAAGMLVLEDRLTDREMTVFDLLGSGLSPDQIASHLGLSRSSIERHLERIRAKCGFAETVDVVRYAMLWTSHRERTP